MKLSTDLERFKLYLVEKNKQISTIRRYTYDIQQFIEWMDKNKNSSQNVEQDSFVEELSSYYSYLQSEGKYSPNTIRRILSVLRHWLMFLEHPNAVSILEGYLKETKVNRELHDFYINSLQIDKLFQSLSSFQGLTENQKKYRHLLQDRNEVIFRLILFYGLSIQELSSLTLHHIHFTSREIELMSRKGKKRTRILQSEDIKKMFQYYMTIPEVVRPNRYDPSPYFLAFDYQRGTYRWEKRLSQVAIQKMIRQEMKRAGLPLHITAQALRKTYIIQQLLNGASKETLRGELAFETTQPLDELERWAEEVKISLSTAREEA